MNKLAKEGKQKTMQTFGLLIVISIIVSIEYHLAFGQINSFKLFQQIIRLVFTVLLMYFILEGKDWARYLYLIFMVLSLLFLLAMLFSDNLPLDAKIFMGFMGITYGLNIYQLAFAENFKEYLKYKKAEEETLL